MDPISIASAAAQGAKLAWQVGKALYDLVEDTKVVDESVKALASEATALGNVCDAVDKQLASLSSLGLEAEDAQLFNSIQMQLSECERSARKLNEAIESVRVHRSSFAKQAVRQIKLNFKEESIVECRSQIRAHTTNLQISLQVVNLKATFLAPKLANQELLEQMGLLQSMIADQGQRIDGTLLQCAKGVLSSGSTLYEESVAGGTVVGNAIGAEYDPHIADWIASLSTLRLDSAALEDVPEAPVFSDDASLSVSDHQLRFGIYSHTQNNVSISLGDDLNPSQEPDVDDEDELTLDLAIAAQRTGDDAFDRLDYSKAESMLREALSLMEELPSSLRQKQSLLSIHYRLAACAFYLHDVPTAQFALVTVVEQTPRTDEDALLLCHAGHLLASLYIGLDQLDAARATCNNSYKTRRRLLGKDNAQCYESLALLAKISDAENNASRSEIYLSTIPEPSRQQANASITTLLANRFPVTASPCDDNLPDSLDNVDSAGDESSEPEVVVSTTKANPSPEQDEPDWFKVPQGWEVRKHLNGRLYYVDHHTRTTRWTHPTIGHIPPSAVQSQFQLSSFPTRDDSPVVDKASKYVKSGGLMRAFRNVTKGYSSTQVKVRNATSNEHRDPTKAEMIDIAAATYSSSTDFYEVLDMLDKRLNEKGKDWRHVLKSLKVLEYCLHEGSELCITWSRKNIYVIKTLRDFIHVDQDGGRDYGKLIRSSADDLIPLISDDDLLRSQRGKQGAWISLVKSVHDR